MIKKPDSLCTSKMIFALSLWLCFLGITSALTIPNKNAEHKPFFEGIKIVVSGDNNNEMIEKTGDNNILRFDNGIANGDPNISGKYWRMQIVDKTESFSSTFWWSANRIENNTTATIFGGTGNQIHVNGQKSSIIGWIGNEMSSATWTFLIWWKNNVWEQAKQIEQWIIIIGWESQYKNTTKSILILSKQDQQEKENSFTIHNYMKEKKLSLTGIKNTFFYNNQENAAQNDNAAEFYSENGLQINTASSVSGITINAGGSFQMVPKDINDSPRITTPGSCNANNNGLYEVVNSWGDICVFYCNGHDWKDAFPGEVRYTGTDGNTETRSDQRKCNEWPTTKSKWDCVISWGMTIANGMTAELYKGNYPTCDKITGTCSSGSIT